MKILEDSQHFWKPNCMFFSHVIFLNGLTSEKSLDGLSLVDALLFAKFAKLSRYTVVDKLKYPE